MGETNFNGSKIYLNSLVNKASTYFSDSIKPIEAEILDASFDRNGEEWYIIDGLWDYFEHKNKMRSITSQEKYVHAKYLNTDLNLILKEKENPSKGIFTLRIKIQEDTIYLLQNNTNKNSCLPLVNGTCNIYRQQINGQDVIGMSDLRLNIKSTEHDFDDDVTTPNCSYKKKSEKNKKTKQYKYS